MQQFFYENEFSTLQTFNSFRIVREFDFPSQG